MILNSEGSFVMRDPNGRPGSGGWVCPYEYSVELTDAHREHEERDRAAERERIAQEITDATVREWVEGVPGVAHTPTTLLDGLAPGWGSELLAMMTAAALQALTHAEKES